MPFSGCSDLLSLSVIHSFEPDIHCPLTFYWSTRTGMRKGWSPCLILTWNWKQILITVLCREIIAQIQIVLAIYGPAFVCLVLPWAAPSSGSRCFTSRQRRPSFEYKISQLSNLRMEDLQNSPCLSTRIEDLQKLTHLRGCFVAFILLPRAKFRCE